MYHRYRALLLLAALVLPTALATGCGSPEVYSQVTLGTMTREQVQQTLEPEPAASPAGLTSEHQNGWPTVIRVTHVAVPEGGKAQWKLELVGSVVHVLVAQTITVDVHYEGPLSDPLVEQLRLADTSTENEFQANLVAFLRARIRTSLTDKWTDPDKLRDDRYRGRFLGLLESSLHDLAGSGAVERDRPRFSATITAGDAKLTLGYLGSGIYTLTLHTTATVGPSPVL